MVGWSSSFQVDRLCSIQSCQFQTRSLRAEIRQQGLGQSDPASWHGFLFTTPISCAPLRLGYVTFSGCYVALSSFMLIATLSVMCMFCGKTRVWPARLYSRRNPSNTTSTSWTPGCVFQTHRSCWSPHY